MCAYASPLPAVYRDPEYPGDLDGTLEHPLGIDPSRGTLDPPVEFPSEIVEAGLTDPMLFIERGVAGVQDLWMVALHELRPAELAVVVVPVPFPRRGPIRAPD